MQIGNICQVLPGQVINIVFDTQAVTSLHAVPNTAIEKVELHQRMDAACFIGLIEYAWDNGSNVSHCEVAMLPQ